MDLKRERERESEEEEEKRSCLVKNKLNLCAVQYFFIFQVIGYLPTLELYDDTLPSRLFYKKIKLERNRERLDKRRYVRGLKK